MKTIIPSGGNDKFYTPDNYAKYLVEYLQPRGLILEPCRGKGAFTNAMPTAEWCEIDDGIDFLQYSKSVDWIVTNPPYSKFRAFLQKSMTVAENIAFLCLINAFFMKARLRDMFRYGFSFKEIIFLDTPKEFPQMGIQLGCVHIKKNYLGECKFTDFRGKLITEETNGHR